MIAELNSIKSLIERLYPIHRSQTGEGVRETLRCLQEFGVQLEIHEVPSGEDVFDWVTPQEWRINDAYIETPDGERVVDYRESNLHLLNGSIPFQGDMPFDELQHFLYHSDLSPTVIPYRTAFFQEKWGFAVTQKQLEKLASVNGLLRVCVDTELFDGSMTYGEAVLPGDSPETVVVWTHTCHPSLANDNLSGIAAAATGVEPRQFGQ